MNSRIQILAHCQKYHREKLGRSNSFALSFFVFVNQEQSPSDSLLIQYKQSMLLSLISYIYQAVKWKISSAI